MLGRFDTMSECDRRTDGRTDNRQLFEVSLIPVFSSPTIILAFSILTFQSSTPVLQQNQHAKLCDEYWG